MHGHAQSVAALLHIPFQHRGHTEGFADGKTEDDSGSLSIAAETIPSGISITDLTNTGGVITARISADCSAALGANTVALTVTDSGGMTATANLTINVTDNTPPTLGTYPATIQVNAGAGTIVAPSAPPADNGTLSLTASAPGFQGTLSVDSTTGVVTIGNAGPAGSYTVTVAATDNCSAPIMRTFTLTVTANACGITINPEALPQPYIDVPYLNILSASPLGNHTFSVTAGELPPGLQLVSVLGITTIAGLPTAPGTYSFTIRATRRGTTCEATRSYMLTIPATVAPILECIQRNANRTYTARFGYENSTGAAVTIPVGADNYFAPGNINRGQTTVFQPGRVTNAFSVTFAPGTSSNLAIWFLRGPDNVLRPINVLTTSIGCQ